MRDRIIILVAIATAMLIAATVASGSTSNTRPESKVVTTSGPNAINPHTCKFLHHEKDVVLNLGTIEQKLDENGRYDIAEDARHDAFNSCVRNWIKNHQKAGVGSPGPAGPQGKRGPAGIPGAPGAPGGLAHYTQVSASGTGQTVTVSCPAGDVVLGGGSPSETTGSWPSSASSWTIARDHLSPKTLTVIATCGLAVS